MVSIARVSIKKLWEMMFYEKVHVGNWHVQENLLIEENNVKTLLVNLLTQLQIFIILCEFI